MSILTVARRHSRFLERRLAILRKISDSGRPPLRASGLFELTDEKRPELELFASCPKTSQALASRCRIILAAANGSSYSEITAKKGTSQYTVGTWKGRSMEDVSTV